ncbi:MAG: DUF288 domain-containing protein [Negativicutes bacterium]|nr:DUF288 domain-containing protein [Negativicutes bacterium]
MSKEIACVVTSINYPTMAMKKIIKNELLKVIVVADKKTPKDWQYDEVECLSVELQEQIKLPLVDRLPWNHYGRKMLGYLWAIRNKYDVIYDTDDDNFPKKNWYSPEFFGEFLTTQDNLSFLNVYQHFSSQAIWPRGLPLNLVKKDYSSSLSSACNRPVDVAVWQGLADADPDVDAIYRLILDKECFFESKPPLVLGKGTVCPFNSQNTFFSTKAFSLLYIPCTVTFRFCDILRGLVAQPILWEYGLHLGFFEATVVQERNPHDYYKDFLSEIPMYMNSDKVISSLVGKISSRFSIEENLILAYEELYRQKIVFKEELNILEDWIKSLEICKSQK